MSGLLGLFFASLTAIFKSSSSIVSKELLDTDIGPYASSWALRVFAIPILLVAVVFSGGIPEIEQNEFLLFLTISSIGGVIGTVSYMKALDLGDISLVDPISALSPLLLLITTPLIVNEIPSVLGLIGVMVIVSGVYLLKVEETNDVHSHSKTKTILSPFQRLIGEPATKYVVILLIMYSITAPVDKLAIEASGPIMYSLSLHIFQSIVLTGLLIWKSDSLKSDVWSKDTLKLSSIGVLSGIASMFQMIALTYTLVIYVTSIKRLGTLIGTVWGIFIRKESGGPFRILGTVLIIIGTILITLSL